jgi:Mg-chelatase subunit ChlD
MSVEAERLRRWRLVLGEPAAETTGCSLEGDDARMDEVLAQLYGGDGRGDPDASPEKRRGGLGSSSPRVARWLGDIRTYFPSSVVRVMQQDAMERLNLNQMLLEPELLSSVEPDVHLVASLLALKGVIPARTKETARLVVRRVVDDLEKRLRNPMVQAIRGALSRAERTNRPRQKEVDWHRTIRLNLKNYQSETKTIIAERVVGFGHRRSALRDIVLCVDQSGSMAASVVYSGIFGAVLASMRAVRTKMVIFDTAVVDLSEELKDPVDLLFGTQLGGGTDINRALAYCQQVIDRPARTILVLITDLYEGGNAKEMLQRAAILVSTGVQVICLLALSDGGAPAYDHGNASALAALGVPCFACTPALFPSLMAAAIQRLDIGQWAAREDITTARPG